MLTINRTKDQRRADSPVVVIGAGVGGLAAAAVMARAGVDVTVLEAHIYPGGCAGTFFHQGYRFDAGATVAAGFYPGGPMDRLRQSAGIHNWPARPAGQTMEVHLADGSRMVLSGGEERWEARRAAFGAHGEAFWRWQEQTADALWDLALRLPPWPPQSAAQGIALLQQGAAWMGSRLSSDSRVTKLAADAFRPVAAHLRGAPERLRQFVDAQLLISAQATSQYANALYGAAALDLPRRGVVHLEGGMGTLAQCLVQSIRQNGGKVLYRQEATRIVTEHGRVAAVETGRGTSFPAALVVANLPPWNIARLAGEAAPAKLKSLSGWPVDGWAAFVVYAGIAGSAVPEGFPLHQQVVVREPLGEGNSIFLSISPGWDKTRAPDNQRAVTISTHTDLQRWWQLFENDREAYKARQAAYTAQILTAAERALPGITQAAGLVLPGTPVTFERFTRRVSGWVGGFPQINLFRTWGPRLGPDLWMVGDSIFPGQSTAAVALGGLRVAREILRELAAEQALAEALV